MEDSSHALFTEKAGPIFERQDVGEDVVLLCRGLAVAAFRRGDSIGRDVAVASLIRVGRGLKTDAIAKLCSTSHGWVCEVRRRFKAGGIQAVIARAPLGPARKLVGAKEQRLRDLHADGSTGREIAKALGVSKSLAASEIRRLGLPPRGWRKVQTSLPLMMGTSTTPQEPSAAEADTSPLPTCEDPPSPAQSGVVGTGEDVDATLAALETLADEEAMVMAEAADGPAPEELVAGAPLVSGPTEHPCRYAGTVLLCAAAMVLGAFFALDEARASRPEKSIYDTRQVFSALMAAWGAGYGSLEAMHERDARALGVILGLERSPSVRTLHRAIAQMGASCDAVELNTALMRGVLSARLPERLWFGVDIHFKTYAGKAPIDKGWDSKRRLASKGISDVVVNDERGYAWYVAPVAAGSALHQHLLGMARTLRGGIGDERPLVLCFDRGGFDFDVLNALAQDGFYYVGYVPATVTLPDLAEIAPAEDGIGERAWAHRRLAHPARLLVERDERTLVPVVTNLPTLVDAGHVVQELRRHRGAQENSFKAARAFAHIDRLVDRGGHTYAPDDRLVPNPARAAAKNEREKIEHRIAALADERPSHSGRERTEINHDRFWTEVERQRIETALRAAPAKVPRVAIEPGARRAELKTRNRLLLQPIKFAAENARRWLLGTIGEALAPSHHPDDLEAAARTLAALLRAPGTIRFADDVVAVMIELPLPPKPHARLEAALRALDAGSMRFTDGRRRVQFRLAPRSSRETLPGRAGAVG